MIGYIIYHNGGQFQVQVSFGEAGFTARILNLANAELQTLLTGLDSEATYDHCREWASMNIIGEFRIEERPANSLATFKSVAA